MTNRRTPKAIKPRARTMTELARALIPKMYSKFFCPNKITWTYEKPVSAGAVRMPNLGTGTASGLPATRKISSEKTAFTDTAA
ncbi:MAG: hypothetical protein GY862_01800 [Gammaproteobacteria bacterium]|nr:hypothetical protein [Gammaproteobacteria bacterium]